MPAKIAPSWKSNAPMPTRGGKKVEPKAPAKLMKCGGKVKK